MRVDANIAKFSDIFSETKPGKAFDGVPGEKHLRLTGDNLHTHRTDKMSGIHFLDRAEKHRRAAEAIKASIDKEVGTAGAGDRVFTRLGLGNKVKVSDLAAIKGQVQLEKSRALTAASRQPVLVKAQPLKGEYAATKAQLMHEMGQLPSRRGQAADMQRDFFRPNVTPASQISALDKLEDQGAGRLTAPEAAGAIRGMFYEPAVPPSKLARLIDNDAVPDAVGYYTGNNTVGEKLVEKDAVTPKESAAAAQKLKQAIDRNLTAAEKAALKERIDFLADLAPVMTDKVGLASNRPEDANDDHDKLWMKSLAVSYPLFLGGDVTEVNEAIGGDAKEAAVKARDLVTALAIHRDTIFG